MIRYEDVTYGSVLMHRKTQKWYLVVRKSLQGILVTNLEEISTPTPAYVILTRDFRSWDHEKDVKEHAIEKEIKEQLGYESSLQREDEEDNLGGF